MRNSRISDARNTAATIDVVTVNVAVIAGSPPRCWLIAMATPVVADFGASDMVMTVGRPSARPIRITEATAVTHPATRAVRIGIAFRFTVGQFLNSGTAIETTAGPIRNWMNCTPKE